VGSSYDLVGEASSYLRSGLSALPMFLPRMRRSIRDFADFQPSSCTHNFPPSFENGTVDMARRRMFTGGSSRSRSPGGPPWHDANDLSDREGAAFEPSIVPCGRRGTLVRARIEFAHTHASASSSPGPAGAAVGLSQRADVARSLVVRLVRAGRHREQPPAARRRLRIPCVPSSRKGRPAVQLHIRGRAAAVPRRSSRRRRRRGGIGRHPPRFRRQWSRRARRAPVHGGARSTCAAAGRRPGWRG